MKNKALKAVFSTAQVVVFSWAAAEYPGNTRNDVRELAKHDALPYTAKMIEAVSGEKKKRRENTEKSAQIKDMLRPPGSKDLMIQGGRIVTINPNTVNPVLDLQEPAPEMKRHLENLPKIKNRFVGVRGPQSNKLPQRKMMPKRSYR